MICMLEVVLGVIGVSCISMAFGVEMECWRDM